ncbi:hypothetical protein NM688_g7804 [Phlebia brevispora]|uniref:Uncharacterized protein n=1 Tax=Phlebia brevispora TaxID=194682 RepID=A0ACC1S0Z2_9APHY|nr:hypothetical protein NM688_g7804 [Phlebia brevispora]
MATLIETYSIFGLPGLQPLQSFPVDVINEAPTIPRVQYACSHLRTSPSPILLSSIYTPDRSSTSPPSSPTPNLTPRSPIHTRSHSSNRAARSALVVKREVLGFGVVEEFDRDVATLIFLLEPPLESRPQVNFVHLRHLLYRKRSVSVKALDFWISTFRTAVLLASDNQTLPWMVHEVCKRAQERVHTAMEQPALARSALVKISSLERA